MYFFMVGVIVDLKLSFITIISYKLTKSPIHGIIAVAVVVVVLVIYL